MKRWIQGMGIAVLGLMSLPAPAELVDTILAKVDQEVILLSEIRGQVYSEIIEFQKLLQQSVITMDQYQQKVAQLLEDTLEESIETKILYREAVRFGVEVRDEDIEKSMKGLRGTFPTEEEFMAYLNAAGESLSDYREQQRKRIMAQRMSGSKRYQLTKEVVISESDVTAYYTEHQDQFLTPEEIRVRQIMLPARRNTAERTKAIATLKQLREQILAGADFITLAKEYSQDPAAADGGLYGWQRKGQLIPIIETAVFALEKGEVSEIVESQFGVHLLRVDDRREASTISLQDARGVIEPTLREEIADKQYDKWIDDLRRHSNVRVFAIQ